MIRRLIFLLLFVLVFPAIVLAQYTAGINFRDSSTYVTDGTNETYALVGDTFPTTRASKTFGWVTVYGDGGRDRDSALDRRLAGLYQQPNDGTRTEFRETLPTPGVYTVCMAIGDASFDQGYQYVEILDNTNSLFVIQDTDGTVNGHFLDANGTDHTAANWPANNTCRNVTFTTTNLVMLVGSPTAQAGATTVAHLYVNFVSAPPLDVQEFVGFEVGDQAETAASSGSLFSTTTVRSGLYSFKAAPSTSGVPYVEITCRSTSGSTTVCGVATSKITVWMNPETRPSGGTEEVLSVADSGTSPGAHKFSLRMNTAGKLLAYGGSGLTLLATSTATPALNTWTRLEITVGTGTSAAYEVKINGSADISGTANLGTVNNGRVRLGKFTNRASQAYTIYWDDFSHSGTDYFGNSKILRIQMTGDSSPATWLSGPSEQDFQQITEVVRDEDTTYLMSSTAAGSKQHFFTLQDVSDLSITGKIKAIAAVARAREDGAGGTSAFVIRFRAGALTSDTNSKDLAITYAGLKKILTEDPNGGVWTYEDMNNLEFGIIENNAIADRVTQVFGMVLYNPDEAYSVNPLLKLRRRREDY